jgi:hypothetical protein
MQRTLRLTGKRPDGMAMFRAASANAIQVQSSGAFRIDDRWTLTVQGDAQPILRRKPDRTELLIPITLNGDQATIELNYDW